MRKPNEPRGLLSLRRTSLQRFDLWDVDQPLEFSFWFAICFFNDAKVPPFIFCNCCLLVDSFLCWLKFFLQACCLPQNVFLCLVSLERGGFFVFETFYFCELVAYPIIISLFTFRVPSVWDHFFCVSMSTTRTSPLLIFSLSFTMSSDFIIFCILAELFVKHWFVFEHLCFKLLKA